MRADSKPVLINFKKEEYELIKKAMIVDRRDLTSFVVKASLERAEEVMEHSRK